MVELPMDRNNVDVNRTGLGGDTSLHSAAARGGHEAVGERSVHWGGVNVDSKGVAERHALIGCRSRWAQKISGNPS